MIRGFAQHLLLFAASREFFQASLPEELRAPPRPLAPMALQGTAQWPRHAPSARWASQGYWYPAQPFGSRADPQPQPAGLFVAACGVATLAFAWRRGRRRHRRPVASIRASTRSRSGALRASVVSGEGSSSSVGPPVGARYSRRLGPFP